MNEALNEMMNHQHIHVDRTNEEHLEIITEEAENRTGIFATKVSKNLKSLFCIPNWQLDRNDPSLITCLLHKPISEASPKRNKNTTTINQRETTKI